MRPPDVVTVAVSRVDGGVTIMRVITTEYAPDGTPNWTVNPTPEYVDRLIAKHNWTGGQAPLSWRAVGNDYVDETTDRSFRNAWRDAGHGKPEVDMPKARDIQRDRLRAARAERFEQLDAEYLRADEAGDQQEKRRIAAEKQRLRDITTDPRIEAAQTPDALKAITV